MWKLYKSQALSETFARGSDRWVVPRGKGLPARLSVVPAGSPGDPSATGSQSKTEREKTPRLAHRGGRRKAMGDFSAERRGPETTRFPLLPPQLFSGAGHAAPVRVHPPPHMVCRSSEHMNFKMVTRAGGTATGVEGSDSPGTSEKARGPGKEAWVAGVEPWVTRTSGVRREAHRAKVEGEMERGPFKRPSRRSGTGGLSSTPGPACGALPWGEPSPGPLPGGFPHTRSRPALPRGGGSSLPRCLPPPPSSQRPPHLPSYSPLSLLPHPLPAPAP